MLALVRGSRRLWPQVACAQAAGAAETPWQQPGSRGSPPAEHGQCMGMAVWVDVDEGNNVERALGQLNRKAREAGLPQELQDRQYHKNNSQRRFLREKQTYNRRMGAIIREQLTWLKRRKRLE